MPVISESRVQRKDEGLPRQQNEEDHARRPHVGGLAIVFIKQGFGRDVVQRAKQAIHGVGLPFNHAQPKVLQMCSKGKGVVSAV